MDNILIFRKTWRGDSNPFSLGYVEEFLFRDFMGQLEFNGGGDIHKRGIVLDEEQQDVGGLKNFSLAWSPSFNVSWRVFDNFNDTFLSSSRFSLSITNPDRTPSASKVLRVSFLLFSKLPFTVRGYLSLPPIVYLLMKFLFAYRITRNVITWLQFKMMVSVWQLFWYSSDGL